MTQQVPNGDPDLLARDLTAPADGALTTIDGVVEHLHELMITCEDSRFDMFDGFKAILEHSDIAATQMMIVRVNVARLVTLAQELKAQRDEANARLDQAAREAYVRGWRDHAKRLLIEMTAEIEESAGDLE